ncbi:MULTISPECIES: hypothetical protein [unclassified Leifsonia]|uniref:hypothetical protein n=1 Tax=unclassified Leifsonia TaxID=2663824 RepID=UPI0006FD8DB0|nr:MULTISPECIES: hypothetical protein [unclassified Leifsonia]KQX07202.1 hypothetical protein ASC59_05240 [Leifsonia sp. Root1293]KRA11485.1 hypothetical protein ASD61_05240 [Leifsonia sp. Root60]
MSITTDALALVPGHTERDQILTTLGVAGVDRSGATPRYRLPSEAPSAEPTEPRVRAEIAALVEQLVRDGQPIPDDVAAPILEAARQDTLNRERKYFIDSVAVSWHHTSPFNSHSVRPAFKYLRAVLARLVVEAKDIGETLGGRRTADTAIAGTDEQIQAWKRLGELARDYDEIRAVQVRLYKELGTDLTPNQSPINTAVAHYANALDLLPRELTNGTRHLKPGAGIPELFDNTLGAATRLLVIAEHTTPWVPDAEAFINAAQALSHYLSTGDEQWRDNHLHITGQKTPTPQRDPSMAARKRREKQRVRELIGTGDYDARSTGTTIPIGGH